VSVLLAVVSVVVGTGAALYLSRFVAAFLGYAGPCPACGSENTHEVVASNGRWVSCHACGRREQW
jgi:hypothetical protein